MATPRNSSYSVASGSVVRGGRYLYPQNARVAIWGQSNAIGRAQRSDISVSPLSSDPGLATFDAGTFDRVWMWSGTAYEKLQPSVNNGANAGQFGAEFGMAVRWMRETPSGNLYLHKYAQSGVSITTFSPSNFQFNNALTAINNGSAWLSANGITLNADAMFWIQGESDAAQTEAWYTSELSRMISQRIASGAQTASTKVLLAQMKPGTGGYGAGVAAAKTARVAAYPATTSEIPMNYYGGDNLHLIARGQVQLGYDAMESLYSSNHINT